MSADTAPPFDPATAGWERHHEAGLIDLLGPLWRRDDQGVRRIAFLAEERHRNFRGVVHGGMIMTFMDQALGIAAWEANGYQPQATIQLDVQFIDAVRPGEFVESIATVARQTRSLLFMRGEARVGDRVVTTANGIWKILGK
jgi:uncharacterized protein (TIGR00369 family)